MAQGSWVESWSNWDLLKLNSFSFGITGFVLAMDTVILPVIVLTVAPDEFKNTYLAVLGISGLLMAALVQPTIGRISDRTQSPLGRRVPFPIATGYRQMQPLLSGLERAPLRNLAPVSPPQPFPISRAHPNGWQ